MEIYGISIFRLLRYGAYALMFYNRSKEAEYSLADFPEVRYETAKVYEFYMKGILEGTAFK